MPMTLAMALSLADGMEPEESLEIDGDRMTIDLWYHWPDGLRSLMTTWPLEEPPTIFRLYPYQQQFVENLSLFDPGLRL